MRRLSEDKPQPWTPTLTSLSLISTFLSKLTLCLLCLRFYDGAMSTQPNKHRSVRPWPGSMVNYTMLTLGSESSNVAKTSSLPVKSGKRSPIGSSWGRRCRSFRYSKAAIKFSSGVRPCATTPMTTRGTAILLTSLTERWFKQSSKGVWENVTSRPASFLWPLSSPYA